LVSNHDGNIHSETYSLLIDTCKERSEKDELFNALSFFPAIKKKNRLGFKMD
jgi:ribonucleotide reductase beta subunit family protein with ferritin-like domain